MGLETGMWLCRFEGKNSWPKVLLALRCGKGVYLLGTVGCMGNLEVRSVRTAGKGHWRMRRQYLGRVESGVRGWRVV